jgi:hypothetical protein
MTHRHLNHSHPAAHRPHERKPAYSKIFRWQLPNGSAETPSVVEVAGTFSGWQKLPMTRDASGGWQITLPQIPGNRTHHYMFFADGKPVHDKHCDGLTVPQGAEEERFAIETLRGRRVFMLFAQTK